MNLASFGWISLYLLLIWLMTIQIFERAICVLDMYSYVVAESRLDKEMLKILLENDEEQPMQVSV